MGYYKIKKLLEKEFNCLQDFLESESFKHWVLDNSKEDQLHWENWIMENSDKQPLIAEAKMILKGVQFNPVYLSAAKVEEALALFHSRLEEKKPAVVKSRRLSARKVLNIAATIVFLLAIGLLIQWALKVPVVSYQTAYGKRTEINLPDGTVVSLNANSSLSYKKNNPRKIWLAGEAFFKVKKEERHNSPFWVITEELQLEVLGTQFNVNSRDQQTKVVLEEGSVKLAFQNGQTKIMKPRELVAFSSKMDIIEEQYLEKTAFYTSWKDGILSFKDVSLQLALQKIKEIYGVEVIFEQEALGERLTTTTGLPLDDLSFCIKALEKSLDIKIEHIDNQLIIKKSKG